MKSSWSLFIVTVQNFIDLVSVQIFFGLISIQDLVAVVSLQELFENLSYFPAAGNHVAMLVDLHHGVVLGVADHVDSCSCSF